MSRFLAFASVGAVATAVHYLLLMAVVELLGGTPVTGTALGFIAGGVTSYFLNRFLVFRSQRRHVEAASRFLVVAVSGFVWNNVLMFLLVDSLNLPYMPAQMLVTALLLGWNYMANSRWTFARPTTSPKA